MPLNLMQNVGRLACVAALLAAVHGGLAATYTVIDLGPFTDLAVQTKSGVTGLNNLGKVTAINVTNGSYRALLYGGGWTNLGTLGGDESRASGLNDSNRVVGSSLTAGGVGRAFLWTPGGNTGVPSNPQMKDLGTLGGSESAAYDINNSGQIAGYAQTAFREHAFVYSGGKMVDIGQLISGLPNSFGYSINNSGHVAGEAYDSGYTAPHAFFYNGSTAVDIGNLNGQGSSGLAINDSDHIVGYVTTSNGVDHAFRYVDGVMKDLGTLGGDYSYANSINNSNVIVGDSYVDLAGTIYHAFIATNNTLVDLNTLLDPSAAGWTLVTAHVINDAGQIAGIGKLGGVDRGYLLNPVPLLNTAPQIKEVKLNGVDVVIRFTTLNNAHYALQSSGTLASGSWSDLISGITGNGGLVTVTDAGGAVLPRRFYRVRLSVP